MPLRNRVDPWGRLKDDPSKAGTVMGNRGILHDSEKRIVKRWTTKAWVACDPNFRGISRKPLFKPGHYSELFFLDEATAFAAGHRPCAYCQRSRFDSFKTAWAASFQGNSGRTNLPVAEMDRVLHAQRVARGLEKVTFSANAGSLPEGTMFAVNDEAFLLHSGSSWRWTFKGYEPADAVPGAPEVTILTPRAIVQLFANGFKPRVHPSVDA